MAQIAWKIKGLYKQDPNDVKNEIDSLGETPSLHDVVEKARDEDSVMHDMFEWDDAVAGEKYRESQAKQIIRMLVVVDEKKEDAEPVRYYVSTFNRDKTYTPTRLIVRDEDAYQNLLKAALADLIAFKKKYAILNELDELLRLIDEVI